VTLDFTRRFFYGKYSFTEPDGYTAVTFHVNDDDEDGDLVCYVDAGDTVEEILGKIEEYERNRGTEESDG
jgi:hypothetical protein